jgi:4-hydroxy-tetrahydrodipicolinate synthase
MARTELVVPPLTPFDGQGAIDWPALQRQIDYIIEVCGATQVVAAGVEAQEYQTLDSATRRELIRRTVAYTAGRVPVVVGASAPDPGLCIELAGFAADLGAAAVQVLAPLRPFGGAPGEADLLRFYETIASAVSLPIVLYLNPGPGAEVSIPATVALARLPQITMIKESSRDLARVSRLIVEIDQAGHARYLTTVQMLLATIMLGGSGATMPAPAAEIARGVIDAWEAGDARLAAALQRHFALFPSRWMHRGLTPTMKTALRLIGCPAGGMRAPWQGLSAAEETELAAFLRTTPLARHMAAAPA